MLGRCVDVSLTQRVVRLTSCGRDVDVNADLRDASSLQRRHAGVGAEVCKLEVYDVQVGGSGWYIGVCLRDDHPLGAPQGTAVLQPAKRQLLWWRCLHLGNATLFFFFWLQQQVSMHLWFCLGIPDRISWLHVRSGCCHRCGRGQEWSRIVPFSKLGREQLIRTNVHQYSPLLRYAAYCWNKPWHIYCGLWLCLWYWCAFWDVRQDFIDF